MLGAAMACVAVRHSITIATTIMALLVVRIISFTSFFRHECRLYVLYEYNSPWALVVPHGLKYASGSLGSLG